MMTFSLGEISSMHFAWIFITFSWLGSILAVICFELVFKKAQASVEHGEEVQEEHREEEEIAEIAQPLNE